MQSAGQSADRLCGYAGFPVDVFREDRPGDTSGLSEHLEARDLRHLHEVADLVVIESHLVFGECLGFPSGRPGRRGAGHERGHYGRLSGHTSNLSGISDSWSCLPDGLREGKPQVTGRFVGHAT